MKNKLLIALLTSLSVLFGAATVSAVTVSGGLSLAYGQADGSGSENVNGSVESESTEAEFAMPSLFLEVQLDAGAITPSIGLDFVPIAGESDTVENARTDAGDTAETTDSGTNKVSMDFENMITIYALLPIGDTGAYAKAGYTSMDVIINDKLEATGGNYDDEEADGYSVALGFQREGIGPFDFMRAEVGHTSFDQISQVNRNTSDISIKMDLEATYAKISFGKNF